MYVGEERGGEGGSEMRKGGTNWRKEGRREVEGEGGTKEGEEGAWDQGAVLIFFTVVFDVYSDDGSKISRQNFSVALQLYLTLQYNTNQETSEKLRNSKHVIVEEVTSGGGGSSALPPSSSLPLSPRPSHPSSSAPLLPPPSNLTYTSVTPTLGSPSLPSPSPEGGASFGIIAVNSMVVNELWRQVTDPGVGRKASRRIRKGREGGGRRRGVRKRELEEGKEEKEEKGEEEEGEKIGDEGTGEDKEDEEAGEDSEEDSSDDDEEEGEATGLKRSIYFSTELTRKAPASGKSKKLLSVKISDPATKIPEAEGGNEETRGLLENQEETGDSTPSYGKEIHADPSLEPFVAVPLPEPEDPSVNPNLTPIFFKSMSRSGRRAPEVPEITFPQFQQACELFLNPGPNST
jgi:hypothetical protein